jgi:hypothetical protein
LSCRTPRWRQRRRAGLTQKGCWSRGARWLGRRARTGLQHRAARKPSASSTQHIRAYDKRGGKRAGGWAGRQKQLEIVTATHLCVGKGSGDAVQACVLQTSSSDIAGHSIATPASAEVHRQIGAKCAELLQPFRPQPLLKWPAQSPPLWTEQPGGTPPQDPSHLHRGSPAAFGCAVERTQLRARVRISARVQASPPAAGSALHAP